MAGAGNAVSCCYHQEKFQTSTDFIVIAKRMIQPVLTEESWMKSVVGLSICEQELR
jgi:hypothetical protein